MKREQHVSKLIRREEKIHIINEILQLKLCENCEFIKQTDIIYKLR